MAQANAAAKEPEPPFPYMTPHEEDAVALIRITNDERALRRIMKRFQAYAATIHPPVPTAEPASPNAVDEAREAFFVELRSYQLALKKSAMICDAESRQVEEYEQERRRLDDEHATLREQIEELKIALEHAQMLRRRKIEYDSITEKVNSLPQRDELEASIRALENDMAAIRAEQEHQGRVMLNQKASLDSIITELQGLRFIGKEKEPPTASNSARATPFPDSLDNIETDTASELPAATPEPSSADKAQSIKESEREEGEEDETQETVSSEKPQTSVAPEDDIEMGEVEEEPRDNGSKKKARDDDEELEEGEASDFSSDLSDPPDD